MDSIVQSHREPRLVSTWVPVLASHVTAAGAPSQARLGQWARRGATDVVTLQREDERRSWLASTCAAHSMDWHDYPLSGRRLSAATDRDTIARLPQLVERLREPGHRVVFHCSAGMHRTGLVLYLVMRHAGMDAEQALRAIERARPVTAEELVRPTRKAGPLVDLAESLLSA